MSLCEMAFSFKCSQLPGAAVGQVHFKAMQFLKGISFDMELYLDIFVLFFFHMYRYDFLNVKIAARRLINSLIFFYIVMNNDN